MHPARLKMTNLAGGTVGSVTSVVLGKGKLYPTEAAATADGAKLKQLTNTSVHTNLTGQGHPTAVVGSSDGWLYG